MRIRTIKPEFWMHEGLCSLPEFTRLLALALLNWADDEGYFMANPAILRGSLFPFLDDSKKIPRSLQELSSVGWIDLGKDQQGRDVGRVCNFSKHQRVDKPKPSEIKASSVFQDASKIILGCVQGGMEGKGKEEERGTGKGMDTSAPASPPLACPQKLEVASWFGRRTTTPWSDRELKAWKALHPETITEGIEILAGPYSAKEKFCRRDLLTLLNNWQGEIDRWRSYAPVLRSDVKPAQSNYEDPPFLTDDDAIFHKP